MDVAAEGKAIAKVNDLVIFVPYVVPGDVVDLQIKRKKNKYAEAEAVKFHELSPNRAVPFCQQNVNSSLFLYHSVLAEPRIGEISGSSIFPIRLRLSSSGSVRQGAGYRKMLAAGRYIQPYPECDTRLCLRT